MCSALSDDRTGVINRGHTQRTMALYLQFYMPAVYAVSCHGSGSLWTPTIHSSTCNSSTYVCTIYTRPVSLGLAQQIIP
jgi:hypothetical protein